MTNPTTENTQESNEMSKLCCLLQSEKAKKSWRTRSLYVEVLGCLGEALSGAGITAYGKSTAFSGAFFQVHERSEEEKKLYKILKTSFLHFQEEGAEILGDKRQFIIRELGQESVEQAINTLCSALKDAYDDVRCEAVGSLGKFRHFAVRALPSLIRIVEKDTDEVKNRALRSIVEICACTPDKISHEIVRKVQNLLNKSCDPVRSLTHYGPQSSFALESLVKILTEHRNLSNEEIQAIQKALRNITGLPHRELEDWEKWGREEGHKLSLNQLPDPFDLSEVDDSGMKEGTAQERTIKDPKGEIRSVPLRTVFCPICCFPILPRNVFCHGCHETQICEKCRVPLTGDKEVCQNCGMQQPSCLELSGRFILNALGIIIFLVIGALLMRGC